MYEKEKEYVKNYLISHNGNDSRRPDETFRKRYFHSLNVYRWCKRILHDLPSESLALINQDALYLAAIFHDIGYGSEMYKNSHPIEGAEIWKNYADENMFPIDITNEVFHLIREHSNKERLKDKDTPLELVIIMEADWLDEEGAMSIVWDSMVAGRMSPQSYDEVYERIKKYSGHILEENPMVTAPARKFWSHKQDVVKKFIKDLEFDLFK